MRKNIFIVGLFILFVLFHSSIWDFYDQKVVQGILSKIEPDWLIDLTFILLAIATLILTIYLLLAKKIVTDFIFLVCSFLFALFYYSRIFSGRYSYESYKWFPELKYIDYLFLLFGSLLILKIWNWVNKIEETIYFRSPFLIDRAWQAGDSDLFGREGFAKHLAEKIQSKLTYNNSGALAIGINAPWGSGKTSFINQVNSFIKKDNRIVIHFNPWRSSSPSKIIEDFFELLIDELATYSPELKQSITSYAKTLTKIDENTASKVINAIVEIIDGNLNKNKKYDEINECINSLQKQIIVYIDDLDRLDKKEIIEVLRIVRNTANFNNLIYVVTYDKGYIEEAIKEFNKYNYKSFLEKIFQFEFSLPKYNTSIVRDKIKEGLKEKLDEVDHELICRAVDKTTERDEITSDYFIQTQRDVIRILNAILFEIETVKNEVQIEDFYYLQLLKLKYPSLHKHLYYKKKYFFFNEGGVLKLRSAKMKTWNEQSALFNRIMDTNQTDNETEEEKVPILEKFLKFDKEFKNLDEKERNEILVTVNQLLIVKDEDEISRSVVSNSFCYEKNFERYFSYSLLSYDISFKYFDDLRKGDFVDYKNAILKWLDEGRVNQLKFLLENVKDFHNKSEWENHLRILIEIGKHLLKIGGPYGINYAQIIDVLNYPKQNDGKIRVFANENEYLNFIKDFFSSAPDPFIFESNILAATLTPNLNLPISKEEIQNQIFDYFKKYCESHPAITNEFRELYNNSIKKKETPWDENEPLEIAKELFVSHYKKYLKGSGLSSFIKQAEPRVEKYSILNEWLHVLFPTLEDFVEYLKTSENIKVEKDYFEEFMDFYQKYAANNYMPIEYKFQYLKPNTGI